MENNKQTNTNVGGDPANESKETEQQQDKEKEQTKSLSFDEFLKDPKNQSVFDKRVSKALEKAREKWDEEAKLTEEERTNKRISEREKALAEKEAELNRREFTSSIKEKLSSQKLPLAFAEILAVGTTNDNIDEVLSSIKSEWDKQLQEAIKISARQKDPLAGRSVRNATSVENSLLEFARKNRKV